MNRLWVRLTLAFVFVTLVGVATVAVLTDWSAGREFVQYLARQDIASQTSLIENLSAFYEGRQTWDGVGEVFAGSTFSAGSGRGQGAMRGRLGFVLADAGGIIVYDARGTRVGSAMTSDEQAIAVAITAGENRTAGYLLTTGGPGREQIQQAEQDFLDELRQTLLSAALAAGVLGLVVGLVISRMITSPLAGLADAARSFAVRDWSRRAPVKGTMEIASVAREFNEMAEAIQSAETLRRNLMADVAHELRTPLSVLQGNLRAILDGVYPLEMSEIATLYDETRLLKRLVDDLRELAIADAGQLPLNMQDIDLVEICRAAVADFSAAAEIKRIELQADVAKDQPAHALGDPDRVSQVLRNLLANAIRHTPAGGAITVCLEVNSQNKFVVSVVDSGEGIAPNDLAHVFDRFYRADESRAREAGGTGLGLPIAKAWVEAMGGTIQAQSEPERGSRFSFSLNRIL